MGAPALLPRRSPPAEPSRSRWSSSRPRRRLSAGAWSCSPCRWARVRFRLAERRAIAAPGALDRVFADGEACGHVGAVNSRAGDPITGRAVGHVGVAHLQADGYRDGVAVVLADENHWQAVDRGEVDALVKVALAGGAVSERAQSHGPLALELGGVRDPRGLRHPRRDDL